MTEEERDRRAWPAFCAGSKQDHQKVVACQEQQVRYSVNDAPAGPASVEGSK